MYFFLIYIFLKCVHICIYIKPFAEKSKVNCLQRTMWDLRRHSDEVCSSHLEHFSDRSYEIWFDSGSSIAWVEWLTSCWAVTKWSYRYLPETSAEVCWPQALSRTVKCAVTVNKQKNSSLGLVTFLWVSFSNLSNSLDFCSHITAVASDITWVLHCGPTKILSLIKSYCFIVISLAELAVDFWSLWFCLLQKFREFFSDLLKCTVHRLHLLS